MTIDLDALEARAKAATSGPWEDLSEHPDHLRGTINKGAKHIAGCSWFETPKEEQCVTVKEALANAAFIAAANPAVVLELITNVRKAMAAQEHWQRVAQIITDVLVDYQKPAGVPLHKRNSREQILKAAGYAAVRDAVEKEAKE